ncbi:hypothetical protein D8I24_1204 [Cupriavidus necator H850]|nr:hypothetical protein D8I24_1204 [Cupriavidus necator H850]
MPPLLSTICPFHGAIVIPNNSPLEYLLAFTLTFLVGALWAHLRCSNRDACRKEQAA